MRTRALRAERSEQHRHAGANVGRFDGAGAKPRRSRYDGAMRIAQHDARAHRHQLVDEEHARLEHLLVHEDHAVALRRRDDGDGHEIGGKRRPRLILELRHMPAKVALHGHRLIARHEEIVALDAALDAKPLKAHERGAQVFDAGALDAERRARHGRRGR